MGNPRSYAKLDEQWMTDPAMVRLMTDGHYESVALYFGLIGYARANDVDDGWLTWGQANVVVVLVRLPRWNPYGTRLRARGLVEVTARRAVGIRNYAKWQVPRGLRKPAPEIELSTGVGAQEVLSRARRKEHASARRDWDTPGPVHLVHGESRS